MPQLFSEVIRYCGMICALRVAVQRTAAKILIAEDNDAWRGVLGIAFTRFGYQVFEARTGNEAVEQSMQTHPDLILMDLGLPMLSGDQAIARIKANPTTRDIPVIVQTAFSPGIETARATQAGAAEILHKPLKLERIRDVLERHLASGIDCTNERTASSTAGNTLSRSLAPRAES